MTTQAESRLQRKIRKHLKKEFPGSWWRKIHGGPYQAAGIPDILGCCCGLFFAFEVKTPEGDEPTELQQENIRQIMWAGGTAGVVKSPEEAIELVRSALAVSKRGIQL